MVLLQRTKTNHSAVESTQLLDDSSSKTDSQKRRHLVWEELPPWMRDNQFILSGYRQPTNSFRKCFASWLYVHNETGNIMTHLVGALVFLVLCFTVTRGLLLEFTTIDWRDITTLYAFLLGAVGCMGLSTLFHTVTCHSHEVHIAYNKCDYIGIVLLIVGSCVPMLCYMFYCHPPLKTFYLSLIFGLGALTILVVVAPQFGTPECRPLRATTFVALGLSSVVPAIHSCMMFGWDYTMNAVQIPYMLMMGATYIAGATIYGSRIPERWWPGRFDYWLHSHQIFHVLVVTAATFHYIGVTRALRWTHSAGPVLCSA
ncbi:HlyIII-domain-containing protein [Coemansia reversa NRRL 1564]|uniref:HlyIII-domain-containing protein n=1 Tax=Coemansia reversa (strain ATCC 12441 / NRRL 1564) TaxID=763665 RepID=A0A2G5B321_COERN|nr:HlyIII-domain-containing protein [Coemansia reversa NRRL 1564]|eukprot:PIA13381.1 HlyIII-domain-containing protein [Coemansia reversa NRRL 1564]